ncbi:hypothetical protein Fot_16227 [Forsythia ovata]|uniref:Uncharacterized protein n=1 Tax=Forsythia ovata TaxID=205694 RepID=A0ABD1WBF1_9LAMI
MTAPLFFFSHVNLQQSYRVHFQKIDQHKKGYTSFLWEFLEVKDSSNIYDAQNHTPTPRGDKQAYGLALPFDLSHNRPLSSTLSMPDTIQIPSSQRAWEVRFHLHGQENHLSFVSSA